MEPAAPSTGIRPAAAGRRWKLVSAITVGLALAAAAGAVAVRSVGRPDEAAAQPLIGSTGVAPTEQITVNASGAPPVAEAPPSPVRDTTKPPTPVRSKTASRTTAPPTASTAAAAPVGGYSACVTTSTARFSAKFTESFAFHHAFINSDASATTGYSVPKVRNGLGADFMIENSTLYRSTGSSWGWTAISGVSPLQSTTGGTYHWQIPLASIGAPDKQLQVVFNGSGTSPEVYSAILAAGSC